MAVLRKSESLSKDLRQANSRSAGSCLAHLVHGRPLNVKEKTTRLYYKSPNVSADGVSLTCGEWCGRLANILAHKMPIRGDIQLVARTILQEVARLIVKYRCWVNLVRSIGSRKFWYQG